MSARTQILRVAGVASAAGAALAAYARHSVGRYEDLDPASAAPGAFLEVEGVRIHYVEAGRGEPVVLLHGLNASTFSFRHLIPELARHYRVVALDLKGFGYSERPARGDYSIAAQAALVERTMAWLGIERAVVVGHSMGGAVAMRLAERFPDRVTRLVLVDSATDRDLRRGLRLAPLLRPLTFLFAPYTLHRRGYQHSILRFESHDPAFVTPELVEGHFRTTHVKGSLRVLTAFLARDRGRHEPLRLEAIRQPTLILWGEHDRLLPPDRGEELARRIPNARLVPVPSAGHLPLEEQPFYSQRALLAFLREPDTVAATEPGPVAKAETTG